MVPFNKTWSSAVFHGSMTMNYHDSLLYPVVVHGYLTIIFAWVLTKRLCQLGYFISKPSCRQLPEPLVITNMGRKDEKMFFVTNSPRNNVPDFGVNTGSPAY